MVSTQEYLCLGIMLCLFKLLGEVKGGGEGGIAQVHLQQIG